MPCGVRQLRAGIKHFGARACNLRSTTARHEKQTAMGEQIDTPSPSAYIYCNSLDTINHRTKAAALFLTLAVAGAFSFMGCFLKPAIPKPKLEYGPMDASENKNLLILQSYSTLNYSTGCSFTNRF
jgi:hypothetical protein